MGERKPLEGELSDLRRAQEQAERGAEAELRRAYQRTLREVHGTLGGEYARYGKDGGLRFADFQRAGAQARFQWEMNGNLMELSNQVGGVVQGASERAYTEGRFGVLRAVAAAAPVKLAVDGARGAACENTIWMRALARNGRELTRDIGSQICGCLARGDDYASAARRLGAVLDQNYRRSLCILHTEYHCADQAGQLDGALESSRALKEAGLGMTKTWHTVQDGRVRRATGKSKVDHSRLEGVTIPVEELFDLGYGVKTLAPGQSGDAANDINCRCYLSFKVVEKASNHAILKGQGQGSSFESGPSGEPRVIGQVDFQDKEELERLLQQCEDQIRLMDHEMSIIICADGTVYGTSGSAGYVDASSLGEKLRGSHGTHNHPPDKTQFSFSGDDVAFFLVQGQQVSRATDYKYTYQMERTADTMRVEADEVKARFRNLYKYGLPAQLAYEGKLDMWEDGYHETLKILAQEYHFRYWRRLNNGEI